MAGDVKVVVVGGAWLGMLGRGDYYELKDPEARIIDFNDKATLGRVLNRLETELATLKSVGKVVYVILNPPGGELADPGKQSGRLGSGRQLDVKSISISEHLRRAGEINAQIRAVAERVGVTVIDPAGWICADGKCEFTDRQGIPYFKDGTHFRASFVRCCIKDFDHLVVPESSPGSRYPGAMR